MKYENIDLGFVIELRSTFLEFQSQIQGLIERFESQIQIQNHRI